MKPRFMPGFYDPYPGNPDYSHSSMDRHIRWESWVFGGLTRSTWKAIGGMTEFDVWGAIDMPDGKSSIFAPRPCLNRTVFVFIRTTISPGTFRRREIWTRQSAPVRFTTLPKKRSGATCGEAFENRLTAISTEVAKWRTFRSCIEVS